VRVAELLRREAAGLAAVPRSARSLAPAPPPASLLRPASKFHLLLLKGGAWDADEQAAVAGTEGVSFAWLRPSPAQE